MPRSPSPARSMSRSPSRSLSPEESDTIRIGKLTKNVSAIHIEEIFDVYGKIVDIDLPIIKRLGTHKGTAWVSFASPAAAAKAASYMDGGQIDGSSITVDLEPLSPRGGPPAGRGPHLVALPADNRSPLVVLLSTIVRRKTGPAAAARRDVRATASVTAEDEICQGHRVPTIEPEDPPKESESSNNKQGNDSADSARIGWAFLSQYYSFLNKDPGRLHCFYTKRSTLIHSTEGDDTAACYGQQEIHAKIMSLKFEDCKVYISNVDSQSSADGGIIVQVIGEMSNANGSWRKFAQTFFLAEQPSGYFVLNDICRYIKEEGDETETAAPTPVTCAPAVSAPTDQEEQPQAAVEVPPTSVESVLFNDAPAVQPEEEEENLAEPEEAVPEIQKDEPATSSVDSFTFHGDSALLSSPQANGDAIGVEDKRELAPSQQVDTTAPPVPEVASDVVIDEPSPAAAEEAPEEKPQPAAEPAHAHPEPATEAKLANSPTPAPAAPVKPTSWASLAASGTSKWGQISHQTKGVSSAAAPPAAVLAPSSSSLPASSSPASHAAYASTATPSTTGAPFTEPVLAVQTTACFVKGVVETVSDKALRDALTSRFGPLKEMDIVRSKACAFVEFTSLEAARRAIQASLRPSDGGEGGIHIDVGQSMPARINVVERMQKGERPISNRARGGGAVGAPPGRDVQGPNRGGRGGAAQRGGSSARGGRGGTKVGTTATATGSAAAK
ncbi:hypothetical protein JCM11641_002818 [Rhodosporidiobolus odoratus]